MNKELKKRIVYIVLMIITFILWLISPMILPPGAFRTTRYCSWNGPCVEPQPMIGITVTIVLAIVFIASAILLIKSLINTKKK